MDPAVDEPIDIGRTFDKEAALLLGAEECVADSLILLEHIYAHRRFGVTIEVRTMKKPSWPFVPDRG